MKIINLRSLLFLLIFSIAPHVEAKPSAKVFLGDGFSLGYWVDAKHKLDDVYLNDVFIADQQNPAYSDVEHSNFNYWQSPWGQLFFKVWRSIHLKLFANSEKSWPSINNPSSKLKIFAKPFASITKDLNSQYDSYIESKEKNEQSDIFIFFNAGDICYPVVSSDIFESTLNNSIDKFLKKLDVLESGSTINWVGPLMMSQLLHQPQLLDKVLYQVETTSNAQSELTCRAVHGVPLASSKASKNKKVPVGMISKAFFTTQGFCREMATAALSDDNISTLANRNKLIQSIIKTKIEDKKSELSKKGITLNYIDSLENYQLHPDDLANNCYHLSERGQKSIAALISSQEISNQKPPL